MDLWLPFLALQPRHFIPKDLILFPEKVVRLFQLADVRVLGRQQRQQQGNPLLER